MVSANYRAGIELAIRLLQAELEKERRNLRYKLGPSIGQRTYAGDGTPPPPPPPPSPVTLPDVDVTLGAVDDSGVELTIPAYDPAAAVAPVEILLFLAPVGTTLPADAAGWVSADGLHSTVFAVPTPAPGPVGDNLYRVAVPVVPGPADYFGQIVLGFMA